MFEISGNLHISLVDITSIHGSLDNTIHLTTVISSNDIVQHIPYSELSKFHVILKSCSPDPPPFIYNPETQIFFTGYLTASTFGGYPEVTVGEGKWVLHQGQSFELVEEFHKARVWGSGYVVKVNYNWTACQQSYVTVQDALPKKGASIRLLAWDSELLGKMCQLQRGDWIKFGGKAGIESYKDAHIVETTPRSFRTLNINQIFPQVKSQKNSTVKRRRLGTGEVTKEKERKKEIISFSLGQI
ncbi:hypothetical protein PtA15_1A73 [Puccinia triticina]|uniref:Uncharacterized protein n=1 Tax=Puccinia triticina TaxID=208348 RepID=A0ABY7CA16_9BASI|nr:uncharacterized protein PtA15_1A73 [Puccinia triticina]WAQ80735.1 hypothetical protein PtA15_1A73 [Puccinia triticina]WAR51628.1 hypothetical protein PtB15_1B64 [Puccinia triticina]